MLFLVQKSQSDMQNVLVRDLYDPSKANALLSEPDTLRARREEMKSLLKLLDDALKVLKHYCEQSCMKRS